MGESTLSRNLLSHNTYIMLVMDRHSGCISLKPGQLSLQLADSIKTFLAAITAMPLEWFPGVSVLVRRSYRDFLDALPAFNLYGSGR